MSNFVNLRKVFIVSIGRTGTGFFGNNLCRLNDAYFSVHEPDTIASGKENRDKRNQILNRHGWFRIIILKALGIYGSRNHSLNKLRFATDTSKVLRKIVEERAWVERHDVKAYIESSWHLFGLTRDLVKLGNCEVIVLVRDPRNWVFSAMNKQYWYDSRDLLTRIDVLGFKRITPRNIGVHDPNWRSYTKFKKLCWVWNSVNRLFYDQFLDGAENFHIFKFEEIFGRRDPEKLERFLKVVYKEDYLKHYLASVGELMSNKVHKTIATSFPRWDKWDTFRCQELHGICGNLMHELGYGSEDTWISKLTLDKK